MICFLRASTIQYDVRLQKYIKSCEDNDIPYIALTWDRVNNCTKTYKGEHLYKRYSPYGRKWKNLFNLIFWQFHLIEKLFKYRKQYNVIHACNIETIIPATLMKLFGKKIVFDIYDSVNIKIERFFSKHIVDTLILPNFRRLNQIGIKKEEVKHFLEIENVPSFNTPINKDFNKHNLKDTIKLSYVGVFEQQVRGLENLINEVLNNDYLTLDIAGIGAGLEKFVIEASKKTTRIKYYGSVDYSKALQIMSQSDFIVAMYYLINPLHKYASPNKYYESLFLGVPMITTCNTLVGNMAEENKTGFAIGETIEDLHNFLLKARNAEFENIYFERATKAKKIWDKSFNHYSQIKLCDEYLNTIKDYNH